MQNKVKATGEFATLTVSGQQIELPIVIGSEGERGIDVAELRKKTGCVSLDPSFMNTASCCSEVTFIDGERGILRYRGYPIEELVRKVSFVDTAYLLVHGALPTPGQKRKFSQLLTALSRARLS